MNAQTRNQNVTVSVSRGYARESERRLSGHLGSVWNGQGGIRTHETALPPTRSPGAPLQPLEHLSRSFGG